jgi:hypothetical protein
MCLECRDRGTITGRQGTKWDKRAEADRPMPRAKLLSFEQETARLRQREAARERRPEVARGSQREAPRLRQQRPSPLPSTPRRGASKVQWSGTVLGVQPRIKLSRSFDQRSHTYQGYTLIVDGEIDGEANRAVDGEAEGAAHGAAQGAVEGDIDRGSDTATEGAVGGEADTAAVGAVDDGADGVPGVFAVGIGKAAQAKHRFRAGDEASGEALPVPDPRREAVDYYKASRLRVTNRSQDAGAEDRQRASQAAASGPPATLPPTTREPVAASESAAAAEPTAADPSRHRVEIDAGPPWLGEPPALEVYRQRGHRRLAARTFDTTCGHCLWGCRMPVEIIVDQWKPSNKRYRLETFCYGPLSCPSYKAGPTRKVPGRRGMSYEEEDWVDEDATAHRAPDE